MAQLNEFDGVTPECAFERALPFPTLNFPLFPQISEAATLSAATQKRTAHVVFVLLIAG